MAVKRLAAVAITTAAVGGGMLAGALFGAPLVSGAEGRGDVSASSHAVGDDGPGEGQKGDCGKQGGRMSFSVAAEALGMTEDELHTALEADGATIATVAEAQGVDLQVVIDALVAEATTRVEEEVADGDMTAEEAEERKAGLVERITEMVNEEHKGRGPGGGNGGNGGHGRPPWAGGLRGSLSAAAEALDMTEEEFRTALREADSIAGVAEAQGVDLQVVIDALVADVTTRIDEEVAAGEMTAEEAEERKADMVERVTEMVNGELPGGNGNGNGNGKGHGKGPGEGD